MVAMPAANGKHVRAVATMSRNISSLSSAKIRTIDLNARLVKAIPSNERVQHLSNTKDMMSSGKEYSIVPKMRE